MFGKTHDLQRLANEVSDVEPALMLLQPALKPVSAYAVVFRYPGRSATKAEARAAVALAKQVREIVRTALRLPVRSGVRRRKPVRAAPRAKRSK